jgi:hypothetical protein
VVSLPRRQHRTRASAFLPRYDLRRIEATRESLATASSIRLDRTLTDHPAGSLTANSLCASWA